MATLYDDLRFSVRFLWRNPSFTFMAVLVLALGIGLNTAVFSTVSAVLFRELAVRSPEQLVYVYRGADESILIEDFRRLSDAAFSDVTAHSRTPAVFSADGESEKVAGELVPANYFGVLGITPTLGRVFARDDDVSTGVVSVVISYDLWTRRFGRSLAVIGKPCRIDDMVAVVIGVAAQEFRGLSAPWSPTQYWATPAQYWGGLYKGHSAYLVGRLKAGVSVRQARAIVATRERGIERTPQVSAYSLWPAKQVLEPFAPTGGGVGIVRAVTSAAIAIVAFVLLIAATNIAGILTARGVSRTKELAVRRALGAGPLRLARQMLAESCLLSAIGGLAGLPVAWLLITLYRTLSPERFVLNVGLGLRVLAFTVIVCVGTGLVVGVAPAMQALKVDVLGSLGSGIGAGTTRGARRRVRHWIVIPQVALSMFLLVVAAAHARALMQVELTNLGYRTEDRLVLTVSSQPPTEHVIPGQTREAVASSQTDRARTFFRSILERVRGVPGVADAGLASMLPVSLPPPFRHCVARDSFRDSGSGGPLALGAWVSGGYFGAMGMSVLRGRDFDGRDTAGSSHVAIVSESLAKRLWPSGDAIGRSLAYQDQNGRARDWLEVVGIVSGVTPVMAEGGERPFIYQPVDQFRYTPGEVPLELVVSTRGSQPGIMQALKRAVMGADPFAQVSQAQTMAQAVAEVLYGRRAAVWTLGVSGLAGLLLAAIGLYGVVSYSVARQLRDMGIRSALGAGRWYLISLVLREGCEVAAIAALPGLGLSVVGLRIASSLGSSVPLIDAAVFVTVPLLMLVVVLLACYIPARRAARVDPAVVLRVL